VIVDFILVVIVALLGVGLTVVGGIVASDKPWVRACFLIGGPFLVICVICQGIRQMTAQSASDAAFMNVAQENGKERQRSDAKIDGLYALLLSGRREAPSLPSKSAPTGTPKDSPTKGTQQPSLPPNSEKLTISQTSKISTRADAPYETEIVIQTTDSFPSLKMLVQCDKPIVDAQPSIGGTMGTAQMMVSYGLLKDHPNVIAYSYGSSVPPFSPANPIVIDAWSKEPMTCKQVATF
jgi:hypothetical protein